MLSFCFRNDLSVRIKDICAGPNLRCAVAFWGVGSEKLFNQQDKKIRIICDVSLGGTSPDALRTLGAPNNDKLRCFPSFHAKVYISDRGAVVGSANASQNGIGFDGQPDFIEAGMFIEPRTDTFKKIEDWFEKLWENSKRVDESAINIASQKFNKTRSFKPRPVRPGSLLDLIASEPENFSEVSIVITGEVMSKERQDEILSEAASKFSESDPEIKNTPRRELFDGLEEEDISGFRNVFVGLHMPGNRLSVRYTRVKYFDYKKGWIISDGGRYKEFKNLVKTRLPSIKEIEKADQEMVQKILEKNDEGGIFSALELAEIIRSL